eukprot:Em0154g1a
MFGGGRLLFGKKNKRLVKRARREWTHTFFCLSEVDADTVPTLSERTALQLQGLGEKQFPLPLDADAVVLDETLKREFPPLSDGGGYDLLTKEEGSSKHLNVIGCPPEGYTTAFLKGVVGAAKVYVRPLQKHIGTDTTTTRSQCVSCIYCGTPVARELLKPHWETCSSQSAPRTDQPAPRTDQPAPCTTQPAPRTTQPAPCTTQPAPCTTQPAPCTTQPAPRTDQPAPRTTQPAPRTDQPAPRTTQPAPRTTQPAPRTTQPAPHTTQPIPCTMQPAPRTIQPQSLRRPSPLPPPIRPPPTHRVVLTPQPHADHIQILDDHQDDDDDASGSQVLTPQPHADHIQILDDHQDDDDASGSQVLTPQPHVDHIQISDDNEDDDDASGSEEMSTKDIVMNLKHGITEERWELSVRRQCILTDALKCLEHPSFAPTKRLSVQFQGEAGVDVGGLSREFFTLLMDEIRQHFWKKGTLIHNSKALKDGVYLKLGQLIAMAVVHSEIHTNLMGKPVYEYLSGRSLCSLKVSIEDIPDEAAQRKCIELQNITDEEQMHNFRIEHYEFLVEAGVMSTTLADKTSNLNELCLHSAILRSVAEIQQLAAGLKTLCVIDALEMYPSLMESYFIKSETAMTAAELRSTFIVTYSEDVDVRLKEEIALTYFDEYMEKCAVDGGKMSSCEEQPGRRITLETIKRFFCGSDYIPVPSRPHLIFTSSTYPSASTCAVQLCIPYVHNSFDAFELCMDEALLYYGGFGVT